MSSSQPRSAFDTRAVSVPKDSPAARAVLHEYSVVQGRVDAFFAAVLQRHPTQLQCQKGCHGCCQAGLSVSAVEAAAIRDYLRSLPVHDRARLKALLQAGTSSNRTAPATADRDASCALLTEDGLCTIYPARPLVCRSQGLPLAYAPELIPEQALRFRAKDGRAVVLCPLNFAPDADPAASIVEAAESVEPTAADILDGDRLDVLLALLNRRYVDSLGGNPQDALARVDLADLVRDLCDSAPT